MIDVSGITKVYETTGGTVEAVSDVSFRVREGEFVSILGPSGCGKSTILMMCGGLESISAGRISIAGMPMAGPRDSIGIMFQESTLLPWRSVLDNVLFPIQLMRKSRETYLPRARRLLETVGLSGFEEKKPIHLSGGMKQRVSICRALVYEPSILLMDEPFSALDAITRDEMNGLLLDLWQRNTKTALFITHSIREAVLLSDRILVMTKRPATVVREFAVPFARPRGTDIANGAAFTKLCSDIRDLIEGGATSADRRR